VVICQKVALGIDDDTRSDALNLPWGLLLREPVPEELAKLGIIHEWKLLGRSGALGGSNRDNSR
jgi:hypothetical protein